MKEIKLTKGYVTFVDDEDYEWLSKYTWSALCADLNYAHVYARTVINDKTVRMHRLLLELSDTKIQVDHINGDTLDNRKDNIRIATNAENGHNKPKYICNKSGYKGVIVVKQTGKYLAYISNNNKRTYLGTFAIAEDAARAYNEAAVILHGKYAKLNEIT